MLKTLLASSLVAVATVVSSSSVQALTFLGDTTGQPTWNRPIPIVNPPTVLSGIGTATPFISTQFNVGTTGSYDFLSTSVSPANWDNYTFLYEISFDPTNQFANILIGNNDFPEVGLSGFNGVNLTAGTNYFFVTTGFANTDFGTFSNDINGVGNVTLGAVQPVPFEFSPALGLGVLGGLLVAKKLSSKVLKK